MLKLIECTKNVTKMQKVNTVCQSVRHLLLYPVIWLLLFLGALEPSTPQQRQGRQILLMAGPHQIRLLQMNAEIKQEFKYTKLIYGLDTIQ